MKAKIFCVVVEKGNSSKRSYGILVEDQSGKAHICVEKFLGKCSEMAAWGMALRQSLVLAKSIRKEAIEIISEGNCAEVFLQENFRTPDKKFKDLFKEIQALKQSFRICLAKKANPKDLDLAMEWAKKSWRKNESETS